jgi:hypothetical protein
MCSLHDENPRSEVRIGDTQYSADIVTDKQIIEIKCFDNWMHASRTDFVLFKRISITR